MARNYTVQTRILKPVHEVFEAVVSSDKLCNYFTDRTSGDLEAGREIRWHWAHYEPELPVVVNKLVANELIELTLDSAKWNKTESGLGYKLWALPERSLVRDPHWYIP